MINFSMNAKAQSSTHNLSNLQQEFDNLFETPLVPRMSRQPSLHIRSRASSEVLPENDEDFSAINSLIHQRVSESSCSIPNPFFKDMDSLQPLEISEIPSNLSASMQMSSNGSHIRNNGNNSNLRNPKIEQQKSKEEANLILPEGDSWPEGWVNLLKSFQRGDVLTPTQQQTPLYRFPAVSRYDYSWPVYYEPYTERRVIQEFRPNTTTIEVDRAEKEDKSLEKNPYYKLKSKKELEEERKNKERINQQESVIVKQQTIVNSKPQDKSKNVSESSSTPNRENDIKTMTRRESGHSNPTVQKEKVVPSKPVEEKLIVKKELSIQKESTPVNGNIKQQDKKVTEEKEIVRIGENNKKNVVENTVKMETPKKEEERTPKKSEEPKETKKQQQDTNKDKNKVTAKEVQNKNANKVEAKVEKEVPIKVEPPKSNEKKAKAEEVVVTTVKSGQKDKKNEKQPVKEEKPIVKEVKPIEIKQEKEIKPEVQSQPISKAKEVVESPREEDDESQGQNEANKQPEEFIELKKKKKKGKNKGEDKAESKKQALVEKVKKETESLIQNQFTALFGAQPSQGPKETKDSGVVKDEKDDVEVLSAGEKVPETKETTTGKSKKKKSKNKKKAEENVAKEEEKIKETDKKTQEQDVKKNVEQEAKTNAKEQIVIESEKKKEDKSAQEKAVASNAETKNKDNQPKIAVDQSKVEEKQVEKVIRTESENAAPEQEVKEVSKSKKKKNKKKKNKEKENDNDTSKNTIVTGGLDSQEPNKSENKKDNKKSQKNNENEGSTEDDDAGNEGIKQEYQFSKSKKKKLKKRAKQQTLAECLENADLKLAELRSEYFIESSILLEDPMILDKFRKLLEFQKEMADEVKGTIVAEAFRERGPFGEPKIKFQVTLKQSSEDMIEDDKDRKKKKKKTKDAFTEFAESTSADFDSLQKILTEDIENIQLNDSDILDPKEDLESVIDKFGYLEMLIKNKTETAPVPKPDRYFEDLENLTLHELLGSIEKNAQRLHEFGGGLGGFLTSN